MLSRDTLFQNFMQVVNGASSGSIPVDSTQLPNMPDALALAFAQAYDQYAQDAEASTLKAVSFGDITQLQKNFQTPSLAGWGAGIGIYWGQVNFQGDGFIDTNGVTQDSNTQMIGDISADLRAYTQNTGPGAPSGPTEGTDRLVGILHSRTLELMVQTTTSDSSGTLDTVPIS